FQGGTLKGLYTVPSYTQVKASSLVRINCFWDSNGNSIYQIVPDIRLKQDTTFFKSIGQNVNGVVTLTGRKRM
ncbi:MAG: hypothetical protein AB1649_26375, partial [Chloroflexota bacterium]